jgi:hypothetical protein
MGMGRRSPQNQRCQILSGHLSRREFQMTTIDDRSLRLIACDF